MPVYEYACTECGESLEVRQAFTDDPLTECPVCSGRLRKVLSPVGVVFKGSGFYRNDSRKAESSSGVAGDKKSSEGAAAKESSGSKSSDSNGSSTGTSDAGSSSSTSSTSSGSDTSSGSTSKPTASTAS
ncbi:MAG TPA: FmdB family zinc ribbon protein [Nocardioidaceae bacterium]|nr:FmdB family zinc ribbon protein [Nocardioidaceae bacterium]